MAEYRLPPRQKMINLVYVILIAMLAINISADTLDTYSLLGRTSNDRIEIMKEYNDRLLEKVMEVNPEYAAYVTRIDSAAMQAIAFTDTLKEDIARAADKKKYTDSAHLKAKEDLDAVPDVMLSAISPKGLFLKQKIDSLKEMFLESGISDATMAAIGRFLELEATGKHISWANETFRSMPAIGGIAYINSIQEAILLSEAELLRDFSSAETHKETVQPDPVPEDSRYVLVNHRQKVINIDGTMDVPVVFASPMVESILYAGYDNPVGLTCIGIDMKDVIFSISGGTGRLESGRYYIWPDKDAGNVLLTMYVEKNGKREEIGQQKFIVRELPLPSPEILSDDNGKTAVYAGNVPVPVAVLGKFSRIEAMIKDPVEISYRIISFETILMKSDGETILSAISDGSRFSADQKMQLSSAEPGDKLYITSVLAESPAGGTVQLPPVNAPIY